jgi:hypothetical protein
MQYVSLILHCMYTAWSFSPGSLTAVQEVPPGFHLITLPFKDNLRTPEKDAALAERVKGAQGLTRASDDQVRAAWPGAPLLH